MTLKREDLLEVARSFEEADRLLRRAQIRAAVRRAFLVGSAQYKSELKRKVGKGYTHGGRRNQSETDRNQ